METLDSALCQWIVLYTHYFNFQFSYLHTFYKPNIIKTKPSTKAEYYFEIYLDKETDKHSTLDPHGPLYLHHKGWQKDGKYF